MKRFTLTSGMLALGICAAATIGSRSDAADFCNLTSQAALRSCQTGAQSGNWLALGKCDNVSDARQRYACAHQASTQTKDAQTTCLAQYNARQAACRRLGTAPYDPAINPANFVITIDNPYFPLTPGETFIYEGQTADGLEHNEVSVTRNTKTILGVTCVEVLDTVKVNGVLTEDTLDWYAQDGDGNVWYFGENSKQVADGLVLGVVGSWMAGVDAARPGIIMEAHPAIGDFYRQEFSLGTAEDLAEVVSLTESVSVRAGSFDHCLETKETSSLEPDALEHKFYAPTVGNILTVDDITGERLELVQITMH